MENYTKKLENDEVGFLWGEDNENFSEVIFESSKKIEDFAGPDSIMVDFANEYIGGGSANWGCVQEEILFLIYPELFVASLFFEKMNHNESIVIKGVRRFTNYHGYA